MSKFNIKANQPAKTSSMVAGGTAVATHEGGYGFEKDAKTELYMLAVSFMGGDDNFYERMDSRFNRLKVGSIAVACQDGEWFCDFVRWLRNDARMRTASVVAAVEGVRGRLSMMEANGDATSQDSLNRKIIDAACARADEPGEVMAYYYSEHGKALPRSIKKGIGDAATRLYTQRSYLRYGAGHTKSVSFADVIRQTHPAPRDGEQSNLFAYICNVDEGKKNVEALGLWKISARNALYDIPQEERLDRLGVIKGIDFVTRGKEDTLFQQAEMDHMTLPAWLGKMTREAWEMAIPQMGVMALLMNLRNFDKVGISDASREYIMAKISDEEAVRDSRVLPMRFLSAFRNAPSVSWHWPIEKGIQHTLTNIPQLDGPTLLMIDMSDSMNWGRISDKSQLTYADAAKIFGAVMKARNPNTIDLVQYGTNGNLMNIKRGTSVVKIMNRFTNMGGTYTDQILHAATNRKSYKRVIIVTDEQANSGPVGTYLPKTVQLYTWNLAGYAPSHSEQGFGNHHYLGGGFSDASFNTIQLIEQKGKGVWPWQVMTPSASGTDIEH